MDGAILEDSSNPRNVVHLTKKEFTVGRSLKCSHVLQDLNVSRQHCGFQFINNKWFVSDQSSNGTSLNGRVLEKDIKTVLNDGDVISLNDRFKYIFKMGNKKSNTNDPKIILSEAEISEIAETVSECAAEFNQNFDATSQEDPSTESASTSQNEKKKKRKLKRKLNAEESDDVGEPKEKMIKSEVKLTEEDDELQCSICTELFIKAVTLTCSHTFCKYCIDQWRRNRADCPICRAKITSVSPTLIIDNLIEKLIDKCSDEVKERRVKMVEERAAAATASAVDAEKRLIVIDSEVSDEDEEMEEDDAYWDYSSVTGWSDEDDEDDEDLEAVGDGPGPYYGGYGRCFICDHYGHWANGCPRRPHRF